MASPHELSGGDTGSPYSVEVEARNAKIGEYYQGEARRKFIKHLNELWEEHPGLIDLSKLPESADREGQKARQEAVRLREAGLMNDGKSKQPGIYVTGYADYEGIAAMEEEFQNYQVPYTLNILDPNYPFAPYNLHLPKGAFRCQAEEGLLDQYYLGIFGAVEFDSEDDFKAIAGGAYLLTGGYSQGRTHPVHGTVGRIEGTGGVLWQNPKTNPDGTPRQEAERAA